MLKKLSVWMLSLSMALFGSPLPVLATDGGGEVGMDGQLVESATIGIEEIAENGGVADPFLKEIVNSKAIIEGENTLEAQILASQRAQAEEEAQALLAQSEQAQAEEEAQALLAQSEQAQAEEEAQALLAQSEQAQAWEEDDPSTLNPADGIAVAAGDVAGLTAALTACFTQLANTVFFSGGLGSRIATEEARNQALNSLLASIPALAAALADLNVNITLQIRNRTLWISYWRGNNVVWLGIHFRPGWFGLLRPRRRVDPIPVYTLRVQNFAGQANPDPDHPTSTPVDQVFENDLAGFQAAWQQQIAQGTVNNVLGQIGNGIMNLWNNLNPPRPNPNPNPNPNNP